MADVHHDRREVRLLHRSGRLVGGHPADHNGTDLDTVRDHGGRRRAVGAGVARAYAEGADDETDDEADAPGHGRRILASGRKASVTGL